MRKFKVLAVLLLVGVLALGLNTLSLATTATGTSSVTLTNAPIFVTVTTPFGTAPSVTSADVVAGLTTVGTATFTVDSTAIYAVTAVTNAGGTTTAAPGTAAFGVGDSAASACQINFNAGAFANGDVGPTSLTAQPATSGGAGTAVVVGLQIDWTQYTDAPSGSYICQIDLTATAP